MAAINPEDSKVDIDKNMEILQRYAEELKAQQAQCPSCGYCPHCGRSNGYHTYPYYPYPYPSYPWYYGGGSITYTSSSEPVLSNG